MRWNPINQMEDVINKFGTEDRIKRFQSGELVLVERNAAAVVTAQSLDNGGVTYASVIDVEAFLDDWSRHLREVYNVGMPRRKKLALPETRVGFGWGVVRVPGLSAQRMFDVLTSRLNGKTWKWCANIDESLDPEREARIVAKGPYVVWCRDRIEADEELKNLSAYDLARRGTKCMTLPERIALEGWFHWKTGNHLHLDVRNVTLVAGSRYFDGHVPSALWNGYYGFYVDWCNLGHCNSDIRAREVVSL